MLLWTHLIPSVKPMAPLSFNNPNSVISFPSKFFVKEAKEWILIKDLSRALLLIKSNVGTSSITGSVFGIVTTEVTPPEIAAWLKVL